MVNKNERIMEDAEVRRFFPDNLADLVGFPEEEIRYLGIHTKKPKEHNGVEVVSESLYLAPTVNNAFLWESGDSLDLRETRNRWIREEGVLYEDMAKRRYCDGMYGSSPLLVLRVQNRTQPVSDSFKFAELLRYADHEKFRGRGLATAVLDSVCDEMASSFGTNFVYVNYGWSAWPKKSEVIPVAFSSEDLREAVMGCFPPGYHFDEFFRNFERTGFFRLTDPKKNSLAHQNAMARYEANVKRMGDVLKEEAV
jgi:hypothetical protein